MTGRPKLHKATTRLFAYGAVSPISVAGQCVCEVSVQGGIYRKLGFYVLAADVKAVPLLGLTAWDQLGFYSPRRSRDGRCRKCVNVF